jgi:hypothetical protein
LVLRWFWNAEIGNFWVPQPFFKKVTSASLNSLRQKGYQILVKNWIFDDPFQEVNNIGHFCARDDPTIRIRMFFGEIGLLKHQRPVRLQRLMRSMKLHFKVIQVLEFSFILKIPFEKKISC